MISIILDRDGLKRAEDYPADRQSALFESSRLYVCWARCKRRTVYVYLAAALVSALGEGTVLDDPSCRFHVARSLCCFSCGRAGGEVRGMLDLARMRMNMT